MRRGLLHARCAGHVVSGNRLCCERADWHPSGGVRASAGDLAKKGRNLRLACLALCHCEGYVHEALLIRLGMYAVENQENERTCRACAFVAVDKGVVLHDVKQVSRCHLEEVGVQELSGERCPLAAQSLIPASQDPARIDLRRTAKSASGESAVLRPASGVRYPWVTQRASSVPGRTCG